MEKQEGKVAQNLWLNMRSRYYQKKFNKPSQESKLEKPDLLWSLKMYALA